MRRSKLWMLMSLIQKLKPKLQRGSSKPTLRLTGKRLWSILLKYLGRSICCMWSWRSVHTGHYSDTDFLFFGFNSTLSRPVFFKHSVKDQHTSPGLSLNYSRHQIIKSSSCKVLKGYESQNPSILCYNVVQYVNSQADRFWKIPPSVQLLYLSLIDNLRRQWGQKF